MGLGAQQRRTSLIRPKRASSWNMTMTGCCSVKVACVSWRVSGSFFSSPLGLAGHSVGGTCPEPASASHVGAGDYRQRIRPSDASTGHQYAPSLALPPGYPQCGHDPKTALKSPSLLPESSTADGDLHAIDAGHRQPSLRIESDFESGWSKGWSGLWHELSAPNLIQNPEEELPIEPVVTVPVFSHRATSAAPLQLDPHLSPPLPCLPHSCLPGHGYYCANDLEME